MNHPQHALTDLQTRFESLTKLHVLLPQLTLPSIPNFNGLFTQFQSRAYSSGPFQFPNALPDPSAEHEVRQHAFKMALFGWTGDAESQHTDGLATCHACWRRVGFWMFQPHDELRASDASSKDLPLLDVRAQHREYCPWINAATQNAGADRFNYYKDDKFTGWEALVRYLGKDKASDVQSDEPSSAGTQQPEQVLAATNNNIPDRAAANDERVSKWRQLKQRLSMKPGKSNVAKC